MDHLARGDRGCHTSLGRSGLDGLEALCAPALTDAGQRGVVRQRLVQAVADELADGEIDLGLTHEPTVMHNTEQEPGQHEADRHLRIDPRPAVVTTVNVGDLAAQPRKIPIAIDPDQDVIVGHELA